MADTKISDLTALTGANVADDDEFVIVDTSAAQSKRITRAELAQGLYQGDNVKAIFGAGSDLQIYHDGSNSFIDDAGTGNLLLRGSLEVKLQKYTGENMIKAIADGAVELNYDNAIKLATTSTGIDVTGTVTADGLTMDTSADSAYSAVLGANRTGAGTALGLIKGSWNGTTVAQINLLAGSDTTNKDDGRIQLRTSNAAGSVLNRFQIDENGDIAFYDSTGTSQNLFWDASASRLGIGNTAPTSALDVTGTVTADGLTVGNGTQQSRMYIDADEVSELIDGNVRYDIWTGGTKTMRLDSGGDISFYDSTGTSQNLFWDASASRLGLGTTAPARLLHVYEGNSGITPNTNAHLTLESDGSNFINILKPNGTIGGLLFSGNSVNADGRLTYDDGASRAMQFYTASAERMRLDSSGRLMVGKTATGLGNVGVELDPSGQLKGTAANVVVGYFNRTSSDGSILEFRKDNTTVGSIGTFNGDTVIGTGQAAFRFNDGLPSVAPHRMDTNNVADNLVDLGYGSGRFKDLYLSGGVYLGGTGAANYLDDYEEGTWTPALTGSTTNPTQSYIDQTGYYTKVGNMVHATGWVYFNISGISGGSGTLQLTNLPFTITNAVNARGAMSIAEQQSFSTAGNGAPTTGFFIFGTTKVDLQVYKNDAGKVSGTSPCQASDVQNATRLAFTFTYTTSA